MSKNVLCPLRVFPLLGCIALTLSGCAHKNYELPRAAPTAILAVSAVDVVVIGPHDDVPTCSVFTPTRERFGNITRLPVGKRLWIGMVRSSGIFTCRSAITFTPQADQIYSASLDLRPLSGACNFEIEHEKPSQDLGPPARSDFQKSDWMC